MKLIILEDTLANQVLFKAYLERPDVEILVFDRPAQFDSYLAEHGWDGIRWVLFDNTMPGESGTAWYIRNEAELLRREIRCVLASGDVDLAWSKTVRADKPVTWQELVRAVYETDL